jgi:hypothetical protein
MLALPAQLRNSLCRSFLEKKRSRTVEVAVIKAEETRIFEMQDHMLPQDSSAPYLSFRPTRKQPLLWPLSISITQFFEKNDLQLPGRSSGAVSCSADAKQNGDVTRCVPAIEM